MKIPPVRLCPIWRRTRWSQGAIGPGHARDAGVISSQPVKSLSPGLLHPHHVLRDLGAGRRRSTPAANWQWLHREALSSAGLTDLLPGWEHSPRTLCRHPREPRVAARVRAPLSLLTASTRAVQSAPAKREKPRNPVAYRCGDTLSA